MELMALQALAGNDAVRALVVQRQPRPATTTLSDPRWSSDTRFQTAANNSPPIRPGDPREVVAKLQQALFDADPVRYPLSVTMRSGHPDGQWGQETTSTVQQFQRDNGVRPVGGFEAGRKTLSALDSALAGRHRPPPVPPVPPEPTLNNLAPAGTGPFQQHVSAGVLDADAALLLNFMARKPGSWMFDSADLAFRDLSNGSMAGMVKWADRARLTPRVGSATATLLNAPDVGGGAGTNQILGNGGRAKSFILIGSQLLADRNAPLRFPMLVLAHELNHYRVTEQADRIEKERAGDVGNAAEYVDTALAKRFGNTAVVRKQFAVEVAARHVAWHVAQEYDAPRSSPARTARAMPARGALFHACVDFAKGDLGAYHDNGYMKELATRPAAEFGRQVAIWLRVVARLDTLNIPSASDFVAAFILAEADHAGTLGFVSTVPADGLA
ncbi:peptidoglycan-binding protein [Amycolatopsis sp. H6(2020)]|nr:peptidoglycan-binding protein [Amycolatopsis sp. H6(2020)]